MDIMFKTYQIEGLELACKRYNGRISFRLEDLSQYRILTVERTFPLHTRVGIVHENGKLVSSLPLPTLLPTDFFYLLTFSQDLREPSLYCDFNRVPLVPSEKAVISQ